MGPDGRRELDVRIEGTADGELKRTMVECKDYNPVSTGPIGIEHVDAIESKKRDLQLDAAFICSNAGFTAGAISKAARTNIGLVSVMRRGDERIRFLVEDEIYTRRIRVLSRRLGVNETSSANLRTIDPLTITYDGSPVWNWAVNKLVLFLSANEIVQGEIELTFAFRRPIKLAWPDGEADVEMLRIITHLVGSWFAHRVKFDSSAALYDWIRRRLRVAPGEQHVEITGLDFNSGTPISEYPLAWPIRDHRLGEVGFGFLYIEGIEDLQKGPDLDALVIPEDLQLIAQDVPQKWKRSTAGFVPRQRSLEPSMSGGEPLRIGLKSQKPK